MAERRNINPAPPSPTHGPRPRKEARVPSIPFNGRELFRAKQQNSKKQKIRPRSFDGGLSPTHPPSFHSPSSLLLFHTHTHSYLTLPLSFCHFITKKQGQTCPGSTQRKNQRPPLFLLLCRWLNTFSMPSFGPRGLHRRAHGQFVKHQSTETLFPIPWKTRTKVP